MPHLRTGKGNLFFISLAVVALLISGNAANSQVGFDVSA